MTQFSIFEKKIFHFLAIGSLYFASENLHAANLTISDAVHQGLVNSSVIKAAESQVDAAQWRKLDAFSGFMPTLAINGNYLAEKKYVLTDVSLPGASSSITFPQVIPSSMWTANAQIPIFDGFATTNKYDAALSAAESVESNLAFQRFQLEREIVLQFYKTIAADQLLEIARKNFKTLEDHLKDVRLFKGVGMSTHYDVLRVEVQTSEAQSEVHSAEDNRIMAKIKLLELMGSENLLNPESAPSPVGSIPVIPDGIAKNKELSKVTVRKDLQAQEMKLDALNKTETAMRRHFFPKLSLFAQYQYYNNRNESLSDTTKYRNAYSTGISMNWLLFDGFSSTARAGISSSERSELEHTLQAKRSKAAIEAEFWHRKLGYYHALFKARSSDIGKSEESVRLARVGQKEGTRTSSDLLDAEAELFRARAGAINAQMGVVEALVNLEIATGKSIYKFW